MTRALRPFQPCHQPHPRLRLLTAPFAFFCSITALRRLIAFIRGQLALFSGVRHLGSVPRVTGPALSGNRGGGGACRSPPESHACLRCRRRRPPCWRWTRWTSDSVCSVLDELDIAIVFFTWVRQSGLRSPGLRSPGAAKLFRMRERGYEGRRDTLRRAAPRNRRAIGAPLAVMPECGPSGSTQCGPSGCTRACRPRPAHPSSVPSRLAGSGRWTGEAPRHLALGPGVAVQPAHRL